MTTPTKKAKGLTDTSVKSVKPKDKEYKLSDGGGLYLLVKPNGGKYWRLKYYFLDKERLLAFGVYPDVSLKDARLKRDAAKKLLAQNIDPSEAKKEEKRLSILQAANTFEAIAKEWLEKQKHLADVTQNKSKWLLDFAITGFGKKAITDITAPDVLAVCQLLEKQEKRETARRIKVKCGQVFRYAIQNGLATYNPTQDLKGALQPVITKHQAAITDPVEVAELLKAIAGYKGQFVTLCALKLAPMVFVRPSELRQARWEDIDLETKEWRYHVNKTNTAHIVPLSRQAVTILKELHALTGRSKYVFPSIRTNSRPMSENTINPALRRLGYTSEQMCGHGFRAMARTLLEEVLGYPYDVIEQQLAHTVRDPNGRAYNRTKHLEQRHKMMQHWSDYLDSLQADNVVAVNFGGVA
jgi:integrase